MKGLELRLTQEDFQITFDECTHTEYTVATEALVKHPALQLSVKKISGNPPTYQGVHITPILDATPEQRMAGFAEIVTILDQNLRFPGERALIADLHRSIAPNLPAGQLKTRMNNVLSNMGVNTYQDLREKYAEAKKKGYPSFERFMRRERNFGRLSFELFSAHLKEKGFLKYFN